MWWPVAWVFVACFGAWTCKKELQKFQFSEAAQSALVSLGSFIMAAAYVVAA